jgi:hypothetical protein
MDHSHTNNRPSTEFANLEDIVGLQQKAVSLNASLGSWAQAVNVTPAAQTAPTALNVAVLQMRVRVTGIFLVACEFGWSDNTTADSVTLGISSYQGPTPTVITGGTSAGFTSNVVSNGLSLFLYSNVNGTGITIGGAPALTVQDSKTSGTLTGLLTANGSSSQNYSFVGICSSTVATKTPFTVGNQAGFVLVATAAHQITFTSMSMFVIEMPFG